MKPVTLVDPHLFNLIIGRLCQQLIENHGEFSNTVLLGIQPRGAVLSDFIHHGLANTETGLAVRSGKLDITFHRDDFRRRNEPLAPSATEIDFLVEGQHVILIDDVLYTGRTIRAAMDALMSFGRPASVELLVLVDRRFTRHLPIQPTYVGKAVDSYDNQRVHVEMDPVGMKGNVSLFTTAADA